jgi:hypothetical protein
MIVGVWISKALNENILVMDCEEVTTQKREVAEVGDIIQSNKKDLTNTSN